MSNTKSLSISSYPEQSSAIGEKTISYTISNINLITSLVFVDASQFVLEMNAQLSTITDLPTRRLLVADQLEGHQT